VTDTEPTSETVSRKLAAWERLRQLWQQADWHIRRRARLDDRRLAANKTWVKRRRQWKKWWTRWEWRIVGALALMTVLFGFIGFGERTDHEGNLIVSSACSRLYDSLLLFVMETGSFDGPIPWKLEAARWLALAVALYAASQALLTIFVDQYQLFSLRRAKRHVIVCGCGSIGKKIAEAHRTEGYKVVVIERDAENPHLRECRLDGMITLIGDATDVELLRRARLDRARYIFATCGQDAVNAEIARQVQNVIQTIRGIYQYGTDAPPPTPHQRARKMRPLTCFTHIMSDALCYRLQEYELLSAPTVNSLVIEYINLFESGARLLVGEDKHVREFIEASNPQLLLWGRAPFNKHLLQLLARNWRLSHPDDSARIRVMLIDDDPQQYKTMLIETFPFLHDICTFIGKSALTEPTGKLILPDEEGLPADRTLASICFEQDALALPAGVQLQEALWQMNVKAQMIVGLYVLTGERQGIPDEHPDTIDITIFGLIDRIFQPEMLHVMLTETLARELHNNYVSNRKIQRIADPSLPVKPAEKPWRYLDDEYRSKNTRQARRIVANLKKHGFCILGQTDVIKTDIGFTPTELESMAQEEHEQWRAEEEAQGVTYGPIRDDAKRINPLCRPWDKLDPGDQDFNRETFRALPVMLARMGFIIQRLPSSRGRLPA